MLVQADYFTFTVLVSHQRNVFSMCPIFFQQQTSLGAVARWLVQR